MSEGNRVGDVLASKYRLEELLGSGGMGHVYRAVNIEIERAVAIKVLRSEHATNAQIVERFLREARAANLVRHPNVVDVVDIGRDGDGSPFIVQELLRGEDLSKYVERRGGKFTLAEVEEYLLPVVDAVAEAHAQGVVHRDIKPENVFLADQGKKRIPKLLDFGISKVRVANIKLTEVGVMMGTPAYMAPEQVQGARDADPRTDVWALGIMLFELLSGRLPFDAEDAPALFYALATKDVPRLIDVSPEVPLAFSTLVERCLRRIPDERYPSALELARDMRHLFAGTEVESTRAHAVSAPAPTARSPQLDIPDLDVPAKRDLARAAPTRLAAMPAGLALAKTAIVSPAAAPQARPAPPQRAQHATVREGAQRPANSSELAEALASSSEGAHAVELSGGMLAGASPITQRRPPASAHGARRPVEQAAGPDLALLVGLAVIGITSICVTAGLTTVAYQPEGWQLVAFVTKPTPMANLIVHGGLGAVAFVLAARSAVAGVKKWRGDVGGGRGAAIVSAILAGALFFAALQLARAAW